MRRHRSNHLLHLALTILTFGTWAPIWLFFALGRNGWRCAKCGAHFPRSAMASLQIVADDSSRPWISRRFDRYRSLETWPFIWRIALEGLFVSLLVAVVTSPLASRGDTTRYDDMKSSATLLFLLLCVWAPLGETLLFQSLPVAMVRWFHGGFAMQWAAASVLFAAAHFLDGLVAGMAAGVVGGFYFGFSYAHWRQRSFVHAYLTTAAVHFLHNLPPFLLLSLHS